MQKELVVPGDFLANQEEFLGGQGTTLEDGKVVSSITGVVERDLAKREVRVTPAVRVPELQKAGLTVTGAIAKLSDKMAFIDLLPLEEGKTRFVPREGVSSMIRISNVRRGFVENMRDEFRVGDIVRARILETDSYTVVLTTDGPNLGVIKAFCSRCRHPLDSAGKGMLVCSQCGWREHRHVASDYRSGKI
jgi:exosome complex component CSL4